MTVQVAASYEDTLSMILADVEVLSQETVPLERAIGRALSAALASPVALPPWDNAGMDGYAVRREDVVNASAEAPVALTVMGESVAGSIAAKLPRVSAGQAVRIMTGAPVPYGANVVVRVEDTDAGIESVSILNNRDSKGRGNIRPEGQEVGRGDLVFSAGTTISPPHLGVLASLGHALVPVHRRPKVAVLSGGNELVMVENFDAVLAGKCIVSSTSYALPAFLESVGAEVQRLPLVRDDLDAVVEGIRDALDDGCDLLLTTGGVSVGAYDYVRDAITKLGGTIDRWRARIRPGGPLGIGSVRGRRWLGLPGNPVSTMVTATLFAAPLVRLLGGHARVHNATIRVRMLDEVETAAPLAHFLRVVLESNEDGSIQARLAGAQASNLLRTLAECNALLHVPEHVGATRSGDVFAAIPFAWAMTSMRAGSTL